MINWFTTRPGVLVIGSRFTWEKREKKSPVHVVIALRGGKMMVLTAVPATLLDASTNDLEGRFVGA